MKVGIIADTHDNMPAIDEAVDMFRREKVDALIHAGDIIAPFAAERFKGAYIVYGNNDGERRGLRERCPGIDDFVEITLDGRHIAVVHGTQPAMVRALVDGGRYDLVVTGHTHRPLIERRGGTLLINPGEACGYLTGKRTLALVDLKEMRAEIVDF